MDKMVPQIIEENHTAVILFSGGADSSLAAVLALEKHRKIILITYDNGFGLFIERSSVMAGRLQGRYGSESVIHKIIDNRNTFISVLRNKFSWRKYLGNPGFFCFGERAAMYIRTAIYCLENQIRYIYDGNSYQQGQTALTQMPDALFIIKNFFQKHSLFYNTPVYEYDGFSEDLLFQKGLLEKDELYQKRRLFCKKESFLPWDIIYGVWDKLKNRIHPLFFIETALQLSGRVIKFKNRHEITRQKKIQEAKVYLREKLELGNEYVDTYFLSKSK